MTLDTLAIDAPDVEIVGETRRRDPQLPDRRRPDRARRRSRPSTRTRRRTPSARGSCAAASRRAQVVPVSSTAEAVRSVSGAAGAPQAALGNRLAATLYGGERSCSTTSTTTPATRPASSGSPAPRTPTACARASQATARRRPRSSSGAPATGRPGWLVNCLGRALHARDQPDADRVAAAPDRPRPLHVLRRLRGRERRGRRRGRRSTACARRCEEVRVLGSYRARVRRTDVVHRTRAVRAGRARYTRACEMPHGRRIHHQRGPRRPTSTGDAGVTVAGCSC